MSQDKYIVKREQIVGETFMGDAIYMRCGPGNRNRVRIAVCPCGHARKLARVLNAVHADPFCGDAAFALQKLEET